MLRIDSLTKKFGKVTAIDNLSLEVGKGVFGLLGANGAGKTTLMRCIAGVYKKYSGDVTYLGENIKKTSILSNDLGYLPQKFGTFNKLTVSEALEYTAILKKLNKSETAAAINKTLDLTNLCEQRKKKVGALSGGMLRRLGIGCAIIGDPKVLIVDEPTAGLDPEERARFKSLVASLDSEKTIMISTHIVEDVEAICNNVIVIDQGRVLKNDTAENIKQYAHGKVWIVPSNKEKTLPEEAFVIRHESIERSGNMRVLCTEKIGSPVASVTVEDGYLCLTKGIK